MKESVPHVWDSKQLETHYKSQFNGAASNSRLSSTELLHNNELGRIWMVIM
jgi:hypothetical protein